MKAKYNFKFVLFMSTLGILLFAVAITCFIYKSNILAIILIALALWGFMAAAGNLAAPFVLERKIIRLLKRNGGQIEYGRIKEFFTHSAGKSIDESDAIDILSSILSRLEKKRIIVNDKGIVRLRN